MSGEDEGFLNRWSRRKQEAANTDAPAEAEAPLQDAEVKPEVQEAEPEFDISKLPPIESITATTDIRAFLAKGVPAFLTQAALRKVWSADPAIRDYIGLSENSWDFNALDGQHGFAPLSPTSNVKQMLADIFGKVQEGGEKLQEIAGELQPAKAEAPASQPVRVSDSKPPEAVKNDLSAQADSGAVANDCDKSADAEVAAQEANTADSAQGVSLPRRHGSALPT